MKFIALLTTVLIASFTAAPASWAFDRHEHSGEREFRGRRQQFAGYRAPVVNSYQMPTVPSYNAYNYQMPAVSSYNAYSNYSAPVVAGYGAQVVMPTVGATGFGHHHHHHHQGWE